MRWFLGTTHFFYYPERSEGAASVGWRAGRNDRRVG